MHQRLYRSMLRIRRVEEEIARIYPTDLIKSPVHLAIGEEAVSVGVCEALQPNDVVFGTYRSHALYLAKGGDLKRMLAELYGKATGCAKGKGGSMHLIDVPAGVMGTSAIVGTTIPQAVGYAYALKFRRKTSVVASFFGDGAVDEGVFHESLNFAGLKKLPIVFICENNRYSIHSHQAARQPLDNICDRARTYGIRAERVEENDVLMIHRRAQAAVDDVRRDSAAPWLLECMTYRWKEHVGPGEDFQAGYRSRDEAAPWVQNDQLVRLAGLLSAAVRRSIEEDVEAEIREAINFAAQSPLASEMELYTDVLKES